MLGRERRWKKQRLIIKTGTCKEEENHSTNTGNEKEGGAQGEDVCIEKREYIGIGGERGPN